MFHPEKLGQAFTMAFYRIAIRTVVDVAGHHVHGSINRSEISVVSILIFALNQVERPIFSSLSNIICSKRRIPDVDQNPIDEGENP